MKKKKNNKNDKREKQLLSYKRLLACIIFTLLLLLSYQFNYKFLEFVAVIPAIYHYHFISNYDGRVEGQFCVLKFIIPHLKNPPEKRVDFFTLGVAEKFGLCYNVE